MAEFNVDDLPDLNEAKLINVDDLPDLKKKEDTIKSGSGFSMLSGTESKSKSPEPSKPTQSQTKAINTNPTMPDFGLKLGFPIQKPTINLKTTEQEQRIIKSKESNQTPQVFEDYRTVLQKGIQGQNKIDATFQPLSKPIVEAQTKKEVQQLKEQQQATKLAKKETHQNINAVIPELAQAKNTDEAISAILKSDMKDNFDMWQQFDDNTLLSNDETTLNDFLVKKGLKNADREAYLKGQSESNPKYQYEYERNNISSLFGAVAQRAKDYEDVLKNKFGDNYLQQANAGNENILNDTEFNTFISLKEKEKSLSTKANSLINDPRFSSIKKELDKNEDKQLKSDAIAKADKWYNPTDELRYVGSKVLYAAGKAVKMLAELPSLATSIDKGYDWTDKLADWGDRFSTDLIDAIPVSTDLKAGFNNKVAKVGNYKVIIDDNGEVADVRDNNNFKVSLDEMKSVTDKYNANPKGYKVNNEYNPRSLADNGLNTVIDMGLMILGTKGAGVLGAGEKMQKLTSMGIAYQQTKRDVYNDAIKKGLDPRNADLLANIIGVAAGTSSSINPLEFNIASGKGLFNFTKTDGLDAGKLALIKEGKLSVKDYAKEFVKAGIKNTIGENIEELGIENTTQAIANNYFNSKISATDKTDGGLDDKLHIFDKQGLETFLITAGTSLLMTPIEMKSQMLGNQQEALKLAIDNPIDFKKIRQIQVEKGQLTQDEVDKEAKIYEDVSRTYNASKDEIKEELKPQLLALLTKKYNIANKINEIKDDVLSAPYKAQLNDINKGIQDITNGIIPNESLVENTVTTTSVDDNNQEQEQEQDTDNNTNQSTIIGQAAGKGGVSILTKEKIRIANKISKGEDLTTEESDFYKAVKEDIDKITAGSITPTQQTTTSKLDNDVRLIEITPEDRKEMPKQLSTSQKKEYINLATQSEKDEYLLKIKQGNEQIQATPIESIESGQEVDNSTGVQQTQQDDSTVQSGNEQIGQSEQEQVPTEKVEEKVKPVRQLGTGSNVYFETPKYRVNDFKGGKVLLNLNGDEDGGMAISNIEFDNVNEAVKVAEILQQDFPNGIPNYIDAEKYVQATRQQLSNANPIPTNKVNQTVSEVAKLKEKEQKNSQNNTKFDNNVTKSTDKTKTIDATTESGVRENTESSTEEKSEEKGANTKPTKRRVKGTPKSRRKVKHPEYLRALSHEPETATDIVLQAFISGAKIKADIIKKLYRNSGREIKQRIGLLSNGGYSTMAEMAHSLWEDQESFFGFEKFDSQEFENAIEDVLNSHTGTRSMVDELNNKFGLTADEKDAEEYAKYQEYEQKAEQEDLDEAIVYYESLTEEELLEIANAKDSAFIDDYVTYAEGKNNEPDKERKQPADRTAKEIEAELKVKNAELKKLEEKQSKLNAQLEKNLKENQLDLLQGAKPQAMFDDRVEQQKIAESVKEEISNKRKEIAKLQDELDNINQIDIPFSAQKPFKTISTEAFTKLLDKLKKAFPNVKVELFGKGNMESAKKALEKYGVDLDLQSIYNIIGLSVLATSSTSQINQQPLITNAVSDNLNLSDGNVVEINDNRLIDKASGNKITDKNKMSASVTEGDIKKLTLLSNKHGVDPYTMIAMTMQETNFDTGLENPFHYDPQNWEKYKGISEDPMEIAVLVFKDKLKYAERLGKKTEAEKIQAYNGYGKIGKKTDAQKGSSVRSWYGISSSSFPIDMNKTPIYGNRVLDIRDNIIKSNPKIVKLVESQSNNIAFLKTKDGTIYGFKTPDGKVFINTDNLNANTPIHEFGHIWQSVFPQEFARGIELLKLSPQGQALIREIQKNPAYKGKTISEIQAEALVTAIGNKGETIFNSNPTLWNRFKEWLSDFFKKIGDKLGIKDLSPDDKLDMFTKKVVGELLGGKVLSSEEKAKQWIEDKYNTTSTQHSIDITPEMKAEVETGMPLFQYRKSELQSEVDAMRNDGMTDEEIRKFLDAIEQPKEEIDSVLNEQPKKNEKRLLNRVYKGTHDNELKSIIEDYGLTYDTESQIIAEEEANDIIEEVGLEKAFQAVLNGYINGAQAAVVYAKMVDHIEAQLQKGNLSDEELVKLKELQAYTIDIFDNAARDAGRFIAMLKRVYHKSLFTYDAMVKSAENAKGTPLTEEERLIIKEQAEKIAELDKTIKELEEKLEQERAENAVQKIKAYNNKPKSVAFKARGKALADKVRKLKTKGLTLKDADGNPINLTQNSIITYNDIIEMIARTIEKTGEILDGIDTALNEIKKQDWYKKLSQRDKDAVDKQIKQDILDLDDDVSDDKFKIPHSLIREIVKNGTEDIDGIVQKVLEVYQDIFPDLDERKVRDIITKYGEQKKDTRDDIDKKISEAKRIGRHLSGKEDLLNGKPPKRSGFKRDKPTPTERLLMQEIQQLLKNIPKSQEEIDNLWTTALEKAKTRITNRIEELQLAIDKKERINKTKNVQNYNDTDLDKLKDDLEAKQKEYDDLFPKEKTELSDEQRLIQSVNAKKTQLKTLQSQKDSKVYERNKKDAPDRSKFPKLDKEIKDLDDKIKEIKEEIKQDDSWVKHIEKKRISLAIKANQRRIEEYRRRINEKDFVVVKNPTPISDELTKVRRERQKVADEYELAKYKYELENRTLGQKIFDGIFEGLQLSKQFVATADLSAPLRQGATVIFSNPIIWAKAFVDMHGQAFSHQTYKDSIDAIKNSKYYDLAQDSKLAITDADSINERKREEQFVSKLMDSNFMKKAPILAQYRQINKGSERAYSGFLNNIRFNLFEKGAKELEQAGYTFSDNPKMYKALATTINNLTGRGLSPSGNEGKFLNFVLFSPKMLTSRVLLMYDLLRTDIPLNSPSRKMAAKSLLGTAAWISIFNILGTMAVNALDDDDDKEEKVNINPIATDFIKVRSKQTTFDPTAGYAPLVRTLARIITEKSINASGKEKDLSKGYGQTRFSPFWDFMENKLSPIASYGLSLLTHKNPQNKFEDASKAEWNDYITPLFVPLQAMQLVENFNDKDSFGKDFIEVALGLYGIGVAQYDNTSKGNKNANSQTGNRRTERDNTARTTNRRTER